jgi:RNA polymerase sigma-70 factor (ECF subfamily)
LHNDQILLEKISIGNKNAFAEMYDKYQKLIYSLIFRIIKNADSADRIIEDVFLEVWEKASLFQESSESFRTWLITLAHNKSISAVHSRRKALMPLGLQNELSEITAKLENSNIEPPGLQKIPGYIVLILSYFEGFSKKEIASMLQLPIIEVEMLMHRGVDKLQYLEENN